MTRLRLYACTTVALMLTVPWFFVHASEARVLGFPLWAAWAVGASVGYAALIAFCIGRYWDVSGGDDDDEEGA